MCRYFGEDAKVPVCDWDPTDGPNEILFLPPGAIGDYFLNRVVTPGHFEYVPDAVRRTYRMRGKGVRVVVDMLILCSELVTAHIENKRIQVAVRTLRTYHSILKSIPREIWNIPSLKTILD